MRAATSAMRPGCSSSYYAQRSRYGVAAAPSLHPHGARVGVVEQYPGYKLGPFGAQAVLAHAADVAHAPPGEQAVGMVVMGECAFRLP